MKYLEVKDYSGLVDMSMPKGIWNCNGSIYVAQGNGIYPFCLPMNSIEIKEMADKSESSAMSENFVLQLLAIGNNPKSVHKFAK